MPHNGPCLAWHITHPGQLATSPPPPLLLLPHTHTWLKGVNFGLTDCARARERKREREGGREEERHVDTSLQMNCSRSFASQHVGKCQVNLFLRIQRATWGFMWSPTLLHLALPLSTPLPMLYLSLAFLSVSWLTPAHLPL